ncbi:MAG: bifunctional UDP-N-acetylglucosamine diphosphorylase/glucosamine-1-phosphate N-acetyltransferase GlmU [Deltaproteobacteria bacterium]|nr:bifunctional UDP-N-acetylglucosamine diphosphorylase/glucosamine-1-phosphate N-acetyltransferase GlmU [Deltaproteobacteria bacterium]
MKNFAAIVLAAGKGTRMKSALPKVLHPVAGAPMIDYPISALSSLAPERVVVVVGYCRDEVQGALASRRVSFAVQASQRGTGHAVLCGLNPLAGFKGDVLILSGDVPLITGATLKAFLKFHRRRGAKRPVVSLITMMLANPSGYGRVVRNEDGAVVAVVEDKDCDVEQKKINEVNSGIYLVDADFLSAGIKKLGTKNAQGEYYLPDLISIAARSGHGVSALTHLDPQEVMGINNRVELATANRVMRMRTLNRLMLSGVSVVDPEATYIDSTVKIGMDTVIHPGVHITGKTFIGSRCSIEAGAMIHDSIIGEASTIKAYSVIESTKAGKAVVIGPFARLRPGARLSEGVRIGNFVEVKKSVMGKGSKANHLSYIGDAVIGSGVNIGAGTITCNYDGVSKHLTRIGDRAFIGSDTQLVAPVKVGKGAYVGSGTTVTRNVPPGALVITRADERVIEGWADKKMMKKSKG